MIPTGQDDVGTKGAIARSGPKLCLIGTHTCANRGDGAILRGLVTGIEQAIPDAKMTIVARYPQGSSYLLGREVVGDTIYRHGRGHRLKHLLYGKAKTRACALSARLPRVSRMVPWPAPIEEGYQLFKEHDLLVQTGGSYFLDLYGMAAYDAYMIELATGRPIVLAGHSIGPFRTRRSRRLARFALSRARRIILREDASVQYARELGLPESLYCVGGDTAWLIPMPDEKEQSTADRCLEHIEGPYVAMTARVLSPFDRRLGISQAEYEARFVRLLDQIVERGCTVLGLSMCTGLDGYDRDDRMVALRIRSGLRHPERMTVLMNEFNDLELAAVFARCALTVGGRLHSTVLSMHVGTPAIGVTYEHKFTGVFGRLGIADMAISVHDIDSEEVSNMAYRIMIAPAEAQSRVAAGVARERERAQVCVDAVKECCP